MIDGKTFNDAERLVSLARYTSQQRDANRSKQLINWRRTRKEQRRATITRQRRFQASPAMQCSHNAQRQQGVCSQGKVGTRAQCTGG